MFAPSPFQGMHSTTFFSMSNVEYDSWYSLSHFDRGKMWRKNREVKEKVVLIWGQEHQNGQTRSVTYPPALAVLLSEYILPFKLLNNRNRMTYHS